VRSFFSFSNLFPQFYFLEQARDHYDVDPASDLALNRTPPTPGLLSSLHPSQLLSSTLFYPSPFDRFHVRPNV
jgi:hypothetical protein